MCGFSSSARFSPASIHHFQGGGCQPPGAPSLPARLRSLSQRGTASKTSAPPGIRLAHVPITLPSVVGLEVHEQPLGGDEDAARPVELIDPEPVECRAGEQLLPLSRRQQPLRTSIASGRSTVSQRTRPLSTRQNCVSRPSPSATTVPSGCLARKRSTWRSNVRARSACHCDRPALAGPNRCSNGKSILSSTSTAIGSHSTASPRRASLARW